MTFSVPSKTDRIWSDIVCGRVKYNFDFIAAKILLGRLTVMIKHNSNPIVVKKGAVELQEVFAKNIKLPSVQRDMEKILNK